MRLLQRLIGVRDLFLSRLNEARLDGLLEQLEPCRSELAVIVRPCSADRKGATGSGIIGAEQDNQNSRKQKVVNGTSFPGCPTLLGGNEPGAAIVIRRSGNP